MNVSVGRSAIQIVWALPERPQPELGWQRGFHSTAPLAYALFPKIVMALVAQGWGRPAPATLGMAEGATS